jgi:general secretion pathway protein G
MSERGRICAFDRGGFSLIELLVVLAILAILASVGMPLAELAHRRAQEEQLRTALREIRSALDDYKRMVEAGRIARPAGGSGYPPNLEVLVAGAPDAQAPQGTKIYFLRRLPRDPFAPSTVPAASTWGLRSYASPPEDPQPGSDVFDVYSKAPGNGLDGAPYRQW